MININPLKIRDMRKYALFLGLFLFLLMPTVKAQLLNFTSAVPFKINSADNYEDTIEMWNLRDYSLSYNDTWYVRYGTAKTDLTGCWPTCTMTAYLEGFNNNFSTLLYGATNIQTAPNFNPLNYPIGCGISNGVIECFQALPPSANTLTWRSYSYDLASSTLINSFTQGGFSNVIVGLKMTKNGMLFFRGDMTLVGTWPYQIAYAKDTGFVWGYIGIPSEITSTNPYNLGVAWIPEINEYWVFYRDQNNYIRLVRNDATIPEPNGTSYINTYTLTGSNDYSNSTVNAFYEKGIVYLIYQKGINNTVVINAYNPEGTKTNDFPILINTQTINLEDYDSLLKTSDNNMSENVGLAYDGYKFYLYYGQNQN
jgi:hypothetical protein